MKSVLTLLVLSFSFFTYAEESRRVRVITLSDSHANKEEQQNSKSSRPIATERVKQKLSQTEYIKHCRWDDDGKFEYKAGDNKWYSPKVIKTAEKESNFLNIDGDRVEYNKGDVLLEIEGRGWFKAKSCAKPKPLSERHTDELQAYLNDKDKMKYLDNRIKQMYPGAQTTAKQYIDSWYKTFPGMTTQHLAIALAVMEDPEGRSALGRFEPGLCKLADPYIAQDAALGQIQTHANWGTRSQEVSQLFGSPSEIETPSNTTSKSIMEQARGCVATWNSSSTHKAAMDQYHERFCYSMAFNPNGAGFCLGLFAN